MHEAKSQLSKLVARAEAVPEFEDAIDNGLIEPTSERRIERYDVALLDATR